MNRILIPVDLTEKNRPAVAATRELLESSHCQGEVIFLHVIPAIADTPYEEMKDFYEPIEREAHEQMALLASSLDGLGVEVRQEVIFGHRARGIVEFADSQDVELIVLSSRTLDQRDPAQNWATVSLKVAFLATCPVLLVK